MEPGCSLQLVGAPGFSKIKKMLFESFKKIEIKFAFTYYLHT
jgi:hypothetical protein